MDSREKILIMEEALGRHYGVPDPPSGDPLEILIRTILSQNTNDRNRDRAYEGLRRRFPRWADILEAPYGEIAEAIKEGGLNHQKAKRIKEILKWVKERWGGWSLSPLCRLPREEALCQLLSLKGVGLKTAYCVLAFGCSEDLFPVDTHILRIMKRIGTLPPGISASKAHELLAPLIPQGKAVPLHLNLIRYGREVCRARAPLCGRCLFPQICDFRKKENGRRSSQAPRA